MRRLHRMFAIFVATGALAAVAAAGPASADYGRGAVFQVEISANNVGGVPGDGAWIWIGLNADGTGDYTMADCVHTGSLLGHPGLNGAAHSRGDVTWTDDGTNLTILGVGPRDSRSAKSHLRRFRWDGTGAGRAVAHDRRGPRGVSNLRGPRPATRRANHRLRNVDPGVCSPVLTTESSSAPSSWKCQRTTTSNTA